MSNAKVLQLLNSVNAYHVDLAVRDILSALSQFPDLIPEIVPFALDTSREPVRTFCLKGTIAVRYHDTVYHIPVSIFMSQNYPFTAPTCFVSPTSEMVINPSMNVDASGRVYLPYITDWKHPQSDLVSLLQVMTIIFGENCPVFTKTRGSASRPPPPSVHPPPYPVPGFAAMPKPPYPTPGSNHFANYPGPARVLPASGVSNYPYPTPDAAVSSGRPPYPSSGVGFVSKESSANPSWSGGTGTGTIQPEHIRASLLSAIEDQLRKKLREIIGTASAELQSVKGMKEELLAGEQKLKDIFARIETQQTQLENAVAYYELHIKEMSQHAGTVTQEKDITIDETIDTTAPLYRQLLRCYCEDCAAEDTIYYLGEALKRNKIPLEIYLKHVRNLSRQQFMSRATVQQCRRIAGLD